MHSIAPAHAVRKEAVAKAPAAAASPSAVDAANAPLAVIIEPTRELAMQTHEVMESLKRHITEPPLRTVRCCRRFRHSERSLMPVAMTL